MKIRLAWLSMQISSVRFFRSSALALPAAMSGNLSPRLHDHLQAQLNSILPDIDYCNASRMTVDHIMNDEIEQNGLIDLNSRCHFETEKLITWLRAKPEEINLLQNPKIAIERAKEYFLELRQKREVGIKAGRTITFHHENMRKGAKSTELWDNKKGWVLALQNTDPQELEKYAGAMTVLTERPWVRRGYEWTQDYCIYNLRGDGRKRFIRRAVRKKYFDEHQKMMATGSEEEAFFNKIGVYSELNYGPIKLLDVGSCTNPFAQISEFNVTAVDLCPGHPSVIKADFLKIDVGSTNINSGNSALEWEEEPTNFLSLPGNFFDVAVFSLVLSYMPVPSQRSAMILKARQFLKCPSKQSDWLTLPGGMLIIIEPYSTEMGGKRLCDLPRLQDWCTTIELLGFKFEEYKFLGRSHALVFTKISVKSSIELDAVLPPLQIAFDDSAVYNRYQTMEKLGGRKILKK